MLVLSTGRSRPPDRIRERDQALLVDVQVDLKDGHAYVTPYPLRYEPTGYDIWSLDTFVYPHHYPTYSPELKLPLEKRRSR